MANVPPTSICTLTATSLSAVFSFLRSAFRRLPPVSRRDRRIATLERRLAKLRRGLANGGDQLARSSYRARIYAERRRRDIEVWNSIPLTTVTRHGKFHVYDLARSHGLDVPAQYGRWDDPADIPWNDLPDHVVIKSAFGSTSRGVFPLRRTASGWQVITRDTVMTGDELVATMKDLTAKGSVSPPFGAEEFLDEDGTGLRTPTDVKIYAFYGVVPLVALRQSDAHGSGRASRFRFVDLDGVDVLDTYRSRPVDKTIPVPEALDELGEAASRLSVAIRTPFARIDMYGIRDRVVFGEVTLRPGGPQWLGLELDVVLGKAWERAQVRLAQDISQGMSPEPEWGPVPVDRQE